jgi:KaiC/GvpD/RAD55 family RecA-like ATPase
VEKEEIRMSEEMRFNRDDFITLFRSYLQSMEDKFPFRRFLLYEIIREDIKDELAPYGFTIAELLDIVSTGLKEMDEITGGGLIKGSVTLLLTEETKSKHNILRSFIKQGLQDGRVVVYATSKRPRQEVRGELVISSSIDMEKWGNMMILDLYQDIYAGSAERITNLVEVEEERCRCIIVPSNKILYQRSLVKAIKSYPRETSKIVVLDVYDDLLRYYSWEELFEVVKQQVEGLRRWNCTSVIALDPYFAGEEKVEIIKKNFNNVMRITEREEGSMLIIEKLYQGTPPKYIVPLFP